MDNLIDFTNFEQLQMASGVFNYILRTGQI